MAFDIANIGLNGQMFTTVVALREETCSFFVKKRSISIQHSRVLVCLKQLLGPINQQQGIFCCEFKFHNNSPLYNIAWGLYKAKERGEE